MNTSLWRWLGACALVTGVTWTGTELSAASPGGTTVVRPSAEAAAFANLSRGMAQPVEASPFADDPPMPRTMAAPKAAPSAGGYEFMESSGCGTGGCGACGDCDGGCNLLRGCGPLRRMGVQRGAAWARVDYLLWWTDGQDLPALVTTSPNGTPQGTAGELPGATILFGGDEVDDNARSGGRLELGLWLDECEDVGVMGRFFALGTADSNFSRTSDGSEILGRPFVDPSFNNEERALLVAYPGLTTGSITADATNDVLVADVFLRKSLIRGCGARLDLLGGYFFSRIDESVAIRSSQSIMSGLSAGVTSDLYDNFSTENEFHAGQIGLLAERSCGLWTMRVLGKVALGNVNQRVNINGSTSVTAGGTTTDYAGGLLAVGTNSGEYERNQFAVVPEVDLSLAYKISCNVEATFGYTFMYWSDVARAGSAIDRTVNTTQLRGNPLIGDPSPEFTFTDGHFWAQGVNAGLQVSF